MAKSIYINVYQQIAESYFTEIDSASRAKDAFYLIGARISDNEYLGAMHIDRAVRSPPSEWWQFLVQGGYFKLELTDDDPPIKYLSYLARGVNLPIDGPADKRQKSDLREIQAGYQIFVSLPLEVRQQIAREFTWHIPSTLEVAGDASSE